MAQLKIQSWGSIGTSLPDARNESDIFRRSFPILAQERSLYVTAVLAKQQRARHMATASDARPLGEAALAASLRRPPPCPRFQDDVRAVAANLPYSDLDVSAMGRVSSPIVQQRSSSADR